MNDLKPNTQYKIVTVQLAIPASINDDEITDGLNEMIRATIVRNGTEPNEVFIADYIYPFTEQFPTVSTNHDVGEGCVFHMTLTQHIKQSELDRWDTEMLGHGYYELAMQIVHGPLSPLNRAFPLPSIQSMANCLAQYKHRL